MDRKITVPDVVAARFAELVAGRRSGKIQLNIHQGRVAGVQVTETIRADAESPTPRPAERPKERPTLTLKGNRHGRDADRA